MQNSENTLITLIYKTIRTATAVFLFTSLPAAAQAEENKTVQQAFLDAITAVASKRHGKLVEIAQEPPEILEYVSPDDRDLFHEIVFMPQSFKTDALGMQLRVLADHEAITRLLDIGAWPKFSKGLIKALSFDANRPDPSMIYWPHVSKECMQNRDTYYPIINRLITSGTQLGETELNINGAPASEAYYYVYKLCFAITLCGADYERPGSAITKPISQSLSVSEIGSLEKMSANGAIASQCLANFYEKP